MSRPVCSECFCVEDETGCGCMENGQKIDKNTIFELAHEYGCYEGDTVGFANAMLKKASEK